jgi:MYXO-CTERM domain-containing protein
MRNIIACIALVTSITTVPGYASVVEFTDKAKWESAVGSFTTLDFILPPVGTPITDHYADLGVVFSGGAWAHNSPSAFPNDGWGLTAYDGAWAHFGSSRFSIAADYPGAIRFELFFEGKSVYLSTLFDPTGTGHFAGLVSSVPFDEVFLHRWPGEPVFIDDLHFGALVPAPAGAALGLLALAGFAGRRRRTA